MSYFVSRQHYWPNGERGVEIVRDLDDASPDMLVAKFDGEGREYDDPSDAVEAAIKIRDAWQAELDATPDPDDDPDMDSSVAIYGFTTFHGQVPTGEVGSDTFLRGWADKERASLTRCDQCGAIITKKNRTILWGDDSWQFCSDTCAEEYDRDWDSGE
jgi:hypothetical protein